MAMPRSTHRRLRRKDAFFLGSGGSFLSLAVITYAFLCPSSEVEAGAMTLKVSTKHTPPFAYIDDLTKQWTGFTFDVLNYCIDERYFFNNSCTSAPCNPKFAYTDYEVVYKASNNDEGFVNLNDGLSTVYLAAPTMTSKREQIVDFTFPFFKTGLGVVSKRLDLFAPFNTLLSHMMIKNKKNRL